MPPGKGHAATGKTTPPAERRLGKTLGKSLARQLWHADVRSSNEARPAPEQWARAASPQRRPADVDSPALNPESRASAAPVSAYDLTCPSETHRPQTPTATVPADVLERVRRTRGAQGLALGVRDPQILLGLRRIMSGVGTATSSERRRATPHRPGDVLDEEHPRAVRSNPAMTTSRPYAATPPLR